MTAVARLLRCTEGQAYTAVLALALALVMVIAGVPAALNGRAAPVAPVASAQLPPLVRSASPVPTPAVPATASSAGPTLAAPSAGPIPAASSARPTPAVPVVGTPRTVAPVPVAAATPAPEASADRAPVRTFATIGAPGAPWGIVTAHDGTVYVGTDNGTANGGTTPSVVMAFRADGTLARTYAVAGQPDGHADGLTGLALDGTGGLVALDEPTSRVLRLDLETGTQSTLATVPDVPPCTPLASSACEPGPLDHAPVLRAVAPDGRGGLLVTDAGQATVWRVPVAGGPAQVWYQSADLAIGDGPAGLTVAGGRVLLTVGTTVDPNALVAPALYALAIGADGTAGARTLVTAFARGEAPQGVVAAASGRIYVALQGADAVAVVGPDGVVQQRLSGEFDAPAGLALRKGSLLVANTSRTGKWTVVDVAVPESGS